MKQARRIWSLATTGPHSNLVEMVRAARGRVETFEGALSSPFLLPDMERACELIEKAIATRRPIVIYGDYDTDGVTATALLVRSFARAGVAAEPYIPHRQTEGYGLNAAALDEIGRRGPSLVITVDCGTTSTELVARRPDDMEIIITDHHLPPARDDGSPAELPPADALINPKLASSTAPFDGYAGVGVAWKLVCALEERGVLPSGTAEEEIGLAALGTVADMMPLRGENSAIVLQGLDRLSNGSNLGLYALMRQARLSPPLTARDVAFGIGPRINAAGRMDHALAALELCITDDPAIADDRARSLDAVNADRKTALARALAEAELVVADLPEDDPIIVLADDRWHMGIVGLIAGRLAERYARPAFVSSLQEEEAKGSARTPGPVPILSILRGGQSVLTKFGGHASAAGYSFPRDRAGELADALRAAAAGLGLEPSPDRVLALDGLLAGADVRCDTIAALAALEPFGCDNPVPLFGLAGCDVLGIRSFGREKTHVGVTVRTSDGCSLEAIAFNKPDLVRHLPVGRKIDLAGTLEISTYRGDSVPQMLIADVQPAGRGVRTQ